MHELVRAVLARAARPVLARLGFRRPGGGRVWRRAREERLDSVRIVVEGAAPGPLLFRVVAQRLVGEWVLRRDDWGPLPLDLLTGDEGDFCVGLAHLLEAEVVPGLERPPAPAQLVAFAEEEEARGLLFRARWYQKRLGRADEVRRLDAALEERARTLADLPW